MSEVILTLPRLLSRDRTIMQSDRLVPSLSASTPNSAILVTLLSPLSPTARSAPRSDSVSRLY